MAISDQISEVAGQYFDGLRFDISRYGYLRALLLYTILLQTRAVLTEIQKHVVNPNSLDPNKASEAEGAIKTSYYGVFTTIGVAGAIIAQIGVSSSSLLSQIDSLSISIQIFLVLSILAGILSVYFACVVQVKLGSLPDSADVKEWLTSPESSDDIIRNSIDSETLGVDDADKLKMPSFGSALTLTIPFLLLNIALASILVGNGIYIGEVYTLQPEGALTKSQSLSLLVIYLVIGVVLLLAGTLPALSKWLEGTNAARKDHQNRVQKLMNKIPRSNSESDAFLLSTRNSFNSRASPTSRRTTNTEISHFSQGVVAQSPLTSQQTQPR